MEGELFVVHLLRCCSFNATDSYQQHPLWAYQATQHKCRFSEHRGGFPQFSFTSWCFPSRWNNNNINNNKNVIREKHWSFVFVLFFYSIWPQPVVSIPFEALCFSPTRCPFFSGFSPACWLYSPQMARLQSNHFYFNLSLVTKYCEEDLSACSFFHIMFPRSKTFFPPKWCRAIILRFFQVPLW